MNRKNSVVTFKPYIMNQPMLLPPSLDELVPENHLVRVVSDAVERMNIEPLLKRYKGGGTSSYHPKMMLKVLVYAYSQRIYSSRQIAKALRENIYFMWLSGQTKPDFRTINRFRSSTMKGIIEETFAAVLQLLVESGAVKLENYFVDGTKIEANANKYTFVWAKSTKHNKEKLSETFHKLMDEIERKNEEENKEYGDRDLEEMGGSEPVDSKKIEEAIKKLDEKLAKDPKDKAAKKASKKLREDLLPRQKRYEEYEQKLAGRNSFSKTDTDATFMRMKEDHMKNGQLKPGYNAQIGTEGQFIVGFSMHQRPTDTGCLIPHMQTLERILGTLPKNVIADSGYGSEENYEYLAEKHVKAYVKYNTFNLEQRRRYKKDPYRAENWSYNHETDQYTCPAGNSVQYERTAHYHTENGYRTERRIYVAEGCSTCAQRSACTKAKYNRHIQVSHRLNELKTIAQENLCTQEGKKLRVQRSVEVESVFGRLKGNWGFRRFLLRGMEKVKVEWGLLCMAHNLTKMAQMI